MYINPNPLDWHTEWSKLERVKQISYNVIYMWNLEKSYSWTYLQSRDRDPDMENKPMDTMEGKGPGMDMEIGRDVLEPGRYEL